MEIFMKKLVILSIVTLLGGASHASATATVTLGDETYKMDSVTCSGGPGSFSVQAQASGGTRLLQLGAFDGDVKSVGFRVDDTLAQVADQTGTFDGKTFKFTGEAQVFTENSLNRRTLSVSATC